MTTGLTEAKKSMWRLVLGFFSGMVVSGVALFGLQAVLPTRAQVEGEPSDNTTSLVELVPDIEKIYREALVSPLVEAEKKIYDPDIAAFYRGLLKKTNLDKP